MKQYRIYQKSPSATKWATLEPYVSRTFYDVPEVWSAVEIMRQNDAIVGISLDLGDRLLNIIAFSQDALAPKAFQFDREYHGS